MFIGILRYIGSSKDIDVHMYECVWGGGVSYALWWTKKNNKRSLFYFHK